MEVQICSNIYIFWLQILEPTIELYHLNFILKNKIKSFVDVDGLFLCVQNDGNSQQKKLHR
jgi:hypothetical protein